MVKIFEIQRQKGTKKADRNRSAYKLPLDYFLRINAGTSTSSKVDALKEGA